MGRAASRQPPDGSRTAASVHLEPSLQSGQNRILRFLDEPPAAGMMPQYREPVTLALQSSARMAKPSLLDRYKNKILILAILLHILA